MEKMDHTHKIGLYLELNAIITTTYRRAAVKGNQTYNNRPYQTVVSIIVRININTISNSLNFIPCQEHTQIVERSQHN